MAKKSVPGVREALASELNNAGSRPAVRGGAASSIAIALCAATPALPDDWEKWFQWPLYALFLLGLVRAGALLLSPPDPDK